MLVRCDLDTLCCRIYIPSKRDVTSSDNVVFDEKTGSNQTNIEITFNES